MSPGVQMAHPDWDSFPRVSGDEPIKKRPEKQP